LVLMTLKQMFGIGLTKKAMQMSNIRKRWLMITGDYIIIYIYISSIPIIIIQLLYRTNIIYIYHLYHMVFVTQLIGDDQNSLSEPPPCDVWTVCDQFSRVRWSSSHDIQNWRHTTSKVHISYIA
jgi:hypothetical protein